MQNLHPIKCCYSLVQRFFPCPLKACLCSECIIPHLLDVLRQENDVCAAEAQLCQHQEEVDYMPGDTHEKTHKRTHSSETSKNKAGRNKIIVCHNSVRVLFASYHY